MSKAKSRRWIVIGLVLTLILIAAGLGLFVYRDRGIEVVHAKRGPITEAIYGLGKVKARHRFEVKIGVISTVKRLHAREGDVVRKGARLIEFDSNAVFHAPFDGTVTLTAADDGETAIPHQPILRLEDLSDRYIEVSIEQQGALRVKRGQAARVSFESLRGQVLDGEVTALFPREDEFLAHIAVKELAANVLPGMTADVSIEVGQIADALLIPLKAVRSGTVTVRRAGRKQKLKVDVGHVDGVWAEVRDAALTEQDEILVMKAAR